MTSLPVTKLEVMTAGQASQIPYINNSYRGAKSTKETAQGSTDNFIIE